MTLKDWRKDFNSERLIAWNKRGTEIDVLVKRGDLLKYDDSSRIWIANVKDQKTGNKKVLGEGTKSQALAFAIKYMRSH